jgi:uncharacterized protein with beta-barrel porin domain
VAPRDPQLFGDALAAFAEANENGIVDLLGRTLPDGGGDTFYNLAPDGGPQARGWMDVMGDRLAAGGAAAFAATTGGLQAGADVALGGGLRLGGAFAYESGHLSQSGAGGANADVERVSLYASQTIGAVGLSAVVSYAGGSERLDRNAGLGLSTARRDVDAFAGAAQASAPFSAGGFTVTPSAGVFVSQVTAGAFAETNLTDAAFAVTGAAARATTASPFATLGLSQAFTTASGLVVTPDAEIGYRYDAAVGGLGQRLTAADGTAFAAVQAGLARDAATLGASVTFHQNSWTAFLKYRAVVAGGWSDNSVQAGVRIAF